MSFQRARHEEQKAQRRINIIKNARALCSEFGVMGWSLNELGRRAAVTKSNLYTYFESREGILLVLMGEETSQFTCDFVEAVEGKNMSIDELSELLASIYAKRPLLCELICVSTTVLEYNTELKSIRDLKLESLEDSMRIAHAITKTHKSMSLEQASQIGLASGIIVAGLWPMAKQSSPTQKLAKYSGFEVLEMDFESTLARMLSTYIDGLMQR